ncbi:hypothetical protein GGE07_005976 [Sinorhizobium terangae]|uniref:DUF1795 domain-containing protein n=1 Tax=Sinorhizobium terangae TaxID=110322 RepID=A0A6N7LJZ9_SINTE|nr:hypothetical protein [Sinorhizobium terangae]MBB4189294.1 hypothetical protein [Sinorhizobium terangae]MQX18193.1 hypothetical protein [Sinorhizobium terangae]
MRWGAVGLFIANSAGMALGEDFKNSYVRFSLPTGWTCRAEGTEFVCDPPHLNGQPVPAIMIMTAKISGPDDNLTAYIEHLKAAARAVGPDAMMQAPTLRTINGVAWVDCTIEGSEIKNYRTRYLAVSKNGVAILYTLSAHKDYFDKLIGSAILAVNTLQVLDDWKK